MPEGKTSHPNEIASFMSMNGVSLNDKNIVKVYPSYVLDRFVFRVTGDRVIKTRRSSPSAADEVKKFGGLEQAFHMAGGRFKRTFAMETPQGYTVINMPYLGVSLQELANDLDLAKLGYGNSDFSGFTPAQLQRLIKIFRSSHIQFSEKNGLIHGDLFNNGQANNIVYHAELNRLFLVDAEALAPADEERTARFDSQFTQAEQWMYMNLLRS